MEVIHHIQDISARRISPDIQEQSLGFVPTMGALHEGHLSLVKKAKDENQRVAVSIFVNPIQFNNPGDLKNYPRTLDQDLDFLSQVLGDEDYVFCPDEQEMYPDKVTKHYDFGDLESVMEGAHRPGHFNGVGVVVNRLFEIIKPTRAYFGEKDFQQLAIIRELVRQENHPIDIVPCPIIREENGLAMSSRNRRLTPDQREQAGIINKLLIEAREQMKPGMNLRPFRNYITEELNQLEGFRTEYVIFAEENKLIPLEVSTKHPFRCFIAVFVGEIRLIDNLLMS